MKPGHEIGSFFTLLLKSFMFEVQKTTAFAEAKRDLIIVTDCLCQSDSILLLFLV